MYEQASGWFPAAPRWLQVTSDEAVSGACEAMSSLRAYSGRFVSEGDLPISADDATARTDAIVAQMYDLPAGDYVEAPPALVRATFPDVGERLAWLAVANLEAGDDERLGKASVIYLDAQTGEPLSVLTAIAVTDAREACGGPPISRRVLLRQYLPLLVLTGYGVIVLAGLGIAALRRRQTRVQEV